MRANACIIPRGIYGGLLSAISITTTPQDQLSTKVPYSLGRHPVRRADDRRAAWAGAIQLRRIAEFSQLHFTKLVQHQIVRVDVAMYAMARIADTRAPKANIASRTPSAAQSCLRCCHNARERRSSNQRPYTPLRSTEHSTVFDQNLTNRMSAQKRRWRVRDRTYTILPTFVIEISFVVDCAFSPFNNGFDDDIVQRRLFFCAPCPTHACTAVSTK
jgi:hypothetical protein